MVVVKCGELRFEEKLLESQCEFLENYERDVYIEEREREAYRAKKRKAREEREAAERAAKEAAAKAAYDALTEDEKKAWDDAIAAKAKEAEEKAANEA